MSYSIDSVEISVGRYKVVIDCIGWTMEITDSYDDSIQISEMKRLVSYAEDCKKRLEKVIGAVNKGS